MTHLTRPEWIAALRSGEFKQAQGNLHDNGAFCCLGLAQKLDGGKPNGLGMENVNGLIYRCFEMPSKLQESLGLSDKERCKLACMNDGMGGYAKHTFSEIADYLEGKMETRRA